ncbi:hypothetical protein LZU85_19590 [Vibrio sp. IRLE0018]|nr:hypothetical protein [Vibrio floridensis]MCG6241960.1 hypothetical protein [Vibrio diabolicus]MCG6454423.1 hypothetical protein [Vibrio parahaemolyticus]MCG9550190.1 hypothetical protein [Vibrio harveyi]
MVCGGIGIALFTP